MTHITDGVRIQWGERFAFGLRQQSDGSLGCFTGRPEQLGITPFGNLRAVLFWRYLFPDWEFATSTGKFMVFVATGITQREWQAAKETSTANVLLLLCRAGIGQRTLITRPCVFDDPRWQEEWDHIKTRDPQDCDRELEAGIGQWKLARSAANPPS